MARLTPQQAREKHARNLKNSIQDITRGVDAVATAPGQLAAKKSDKMLANLQEAISSGRWAQRTASVSLEDWKRLMKEKGVNRISSGIDGAAGKVEDFYSQLFPFQDALLSKVNQMPDLTLEDNIQRMTTMVRGMAGFHRK